MAAARIRGRGAGSGRSSASEGPGTVSDGPAGSAELPSGGKHSVLTYGPEYPVKTMRVRTTDGQLTFSFAGDLLFDPSYAAGNAILSRGIEGSFAPEALSAMRGSDIFLVNNEFTYTTSGRRNNKTFTFRTNPSNAALLNEMGVDLVTLGNNHTYDFMEQGLLDTLSSLDAVGIPYIGAGRNIAEASAPIYIDADGMIIAVVNATEIEHSMSPYTRGATENSPGVFACYDPALLYEAVRAANEKADLVIAVMHWGIEGQNTIDNRQPAIARALVDAGADLIIGGHSHCLQTVDFVDDVPVFYSLGNFLFVSKDVNTGIARVTIDTEKKELGSVQFLPYLQAGCRVTCPDAAGQARILEFLRSFSPNVLIDENGFISKKGS